MHSVIIESKREMTMDRLAKPWGFEEIIIKNEFFIIKRIVINSGSRCSLHYHKNKIEIIIYNNGYIEEVPPNKVHRLCGPAEVIEVSHGEENDIVRIEDDYDRKQI
jgi:hypothetical protein